MEFDLALLNINRHGVGALVRVNDESDLSAIINLTCKQRDSLWLS